MHLILKWSNIIYAFTKVNNIWYAFDNRRINTIYILKFCISHMSNQHRPWKIDLQYDYQKKKIGLQYNNPYFNFNRWIGFFNYTLVYSKIINSNSEHFPNNSTTPTHSTQVSSHNPNNMFQLWNCIIVPLGNEHSQTFTIPSIHKYRF
jgi:hypothetical protein